MQAGFLGGAGFIGSYLSQYLVSRTGCDLRLLIRNAAQRPVVPAAEVMTGDLLSRADCERFVADLDVIYYLAHTNTPVTSDQDQPTDATMNLLPLLNLLDAIRRRRNKPHIVYFSSGGAVYSRRAERTPFRECDETGPSSSYGILKLTAEHYLRVTAERGEASATVLRVGNAYGTLLPEYRTQGFIGVALSHILNGNPVRVFGNPENVRDYVHLEDISAAACAAAKARRVFDVFNIGTGRGYSVNQVLGLIRNSYGAAFPVVYDARPGEWLTDWVVLDSSRAREEIGWSATVDLQDGIHRMVCGLRGQANTTAT